jgi:transcriptional regulator with XRE-family HTH domain
MAGTLTGTRIRDWRLSRGLRQSDLAQEAGISPSYLNLIEHNRRRIGGRILNKIARALDIDPAQLSDGGEAVVLGGLAEIAQRNSLDDLEVGRLEAFATQFPGWAQMMLDLQGTISALEARIQVLSDRLANDPHLADALHEVISAVTAIRSTASILVTGEEVDAEWRERFHRNIYQDSVRLAEQSRALVSFLEASDDGQTHLLSSLDEAERYFSALVDAVGVDALESGAENRMSNGELVQGMSEAGRFRFDRIMNELRQDERLWPMSDVAGLFGAVAGDLGDFVIQSGRAVPLAIRRFVACQRLANGAKDFSYFEIDPTGELLRCDDGLQIGLGSGADICPRWPVFDGASQPGRLKQRVVRIAGRDKVEYEAIGGVFPEQNGTGIRGYLLILPVTGGEGPGITDSGREIGPGCRICSVQNCDMRREPSLLAAAAIVPQATSL